MLSMNDLKLGTVISFRDEPYVVIKSQHVQMGRGSAVVRTKLRNLVSGSVLEETFKHGDKFEEADLGHGKASFLYKEGDQYHFMDGASFEQFSLAEDDLGMKVHFLKEGGDVDVLSFKGKPVNIDLPIKMEFEVTETPEGARGDTAQGNVTKEATIETGYVVKVPLFVKQGEKIRVNTETGEYVERVS